MTSAHPAANADVPSAQLAAAAHGTFSRREHFARVGSTNDVVAEWLAHGEPEVCLATADEQTHGRGREGRAWEAAAGSSLLLSLGFRPTWLAPDRVWWLAAVVALAMADAAEQVAGLSAGVVRLKWPNDLVVEFERPPKEAANNDRSTASSVRKLAGVLGETVGLGSHDPRAIIGLGINADWDRDDFPPHLAAGMTSLRDASGGRPMDPRRLLETFLGRLETRIEGLGQGQFAMAEWQDRQITTGRLIDLVYPDERRVTVRALGVDPQSGALVVDQDNRERVVHSAEILHVRLTDQTPAARTPADVGV